MKRPDYFLYLNRHSISRSPPLQQWSPQPTCHASDQDHASGRTEIRLRCCAYRHSLFLITQADSLHVARIMDEFASQ